MIDTSTIVPVGIWMCLPPASKANPAPTAAPFPASPAAAPIRALSAIGNLFFFG
ncbi:MAG: hypothetical protein KAV45_13130 [Calditrichia bacterium]|nr:hypothetical protein [Calditrichia bacterium]